MAARSFPCIAKHQVNCCAREKCSVAAVPSISPRPVSMRQPIAATRGKRAPTCAGSEAEGNDKKGGRPSAAASDRDVYPNSFFVARGNRRPVQIEPRSVTRRRNLNAPRAKGCERLRDPEDQSKLGYSLE